MSTPVALLIFFFAVIVLSRLKRKVGPSEWPYYAKKLLSSPEQVLYWRLTKALPDQIVLSQVALSQLLGVKKGHRYYDWHNRINRLVADFVICKKDSSVVAVVELDDSTHDSQRRKETDAKKDKALSAAGIKVVRWNTRELPNDEQIRAQLVAQQALPADRPRAVPPAPSAVLSSVHELRSSAVPGASDAEPSFQRTPLAALAAASRAPMKNPDTRILSGFSPSARDDAELDPR